MTEQEQMALLTRIYTEVLGQKPPEHYAYDETLGCYTDKEPVTFLHITDSLGWHPERWPAEHVDWNSAMTTLHEYFRLHPSQIPKILTAILFTWGQPEDVLRAIAQAARIA